MRALLQLWHAILHDHIARLQVEQRDSHPLAKSIVASFTGCIGDFVASGQTLPEVIGSQRISTLVISAHVIKKLCNHTIFKPP